MAVSPSVRRRIGAAASLALSVLLLSSCASVMRSVRGPTKADERRTTSVTTLNLNVRKGPGMGHRVLMTLPKGTAVEVLGSERTWRKIRAERKGKPTLGWVAAKYLKAGAAPVQVAAAKPKTDRAAAKAERERQEAERERERALAKAEREAERERARAAAKAERERREVEEQRERAIAKAEREQREAERQREKSLAKAERDRREAERQREQAIAKAERARRDAEERSERDGSLARWHAPEASKPAPAPEPETEAAMVAALPATQPKPVLAPPPSIIDSVGYAAETRPLRESLARGKFTELDWHFDRMGSPPRAADPEAPAAADAIGFFPLLERGAVEVDRGRVERAAHTFASAEELLASRAIESPERGLGLGRLFSSRPAETPTNGAFGEPFERVWALDYHALALLLAGDPEAIPVAERAIAAQQNEREQLERAIEAAEREVADARERVGDETAKAVADRLEREYARSADRAKKTASAFDNPFAHYVAAIAEELGGRRDPKLRDKARAHYAEALRLNPKSELFREAVDDLSTDDDAPDEEATDDRVVHVLIAEGFAPEKGALHYPSAAHGESIEVRLPIYSPVPSTFATAALAVDPTEPPVVLSEIVDVEAASFRYEQDTRARRELAVLRAVRAGDDMPEPDTSSWMTLPARFYAARLRLPKGSMKLALATFDEQHQRVGGTTVVLDPDADALIYLRSAGPIIAIRATSPEWFRGPTATASADALVP